MPELDLPATMLDAAQQVLYERAHVTGESARDTARLVLVAAGVPALIEALAELADAIDQAGDRQRYWPRDMRLDGTARLVDLALDKALAVLPPQELDEHG